MATTNIGDTEVYDLLDLNDFKSQIWTLTQTRSSSVEHHVTGRPELRYVVLFTSRFKFYSKIMNKSKLQIIL